MTDKVPSFFYHELSKLHQKPPVFSHDTVADLWTDPHVARQMLDYHLNGTVDVSSRKTEFIDRSASWMIEKFALDSTSKVADFGCGPGLYCQRLARSGAHITGIDFSASSLEYARNQRDRENLTIDYLESDYLQFQSHRQFDLIIMIMCDFSVLSPVQRRQLLGLFYSHLRPGGAVVLDVHHLPYFHQLPEKIDYAPNLMNGFWSARPYFGFLQVFKYEVESVVLDKYTLYFEGGEKREIFNWYQCFERSQLEEEFRAAGFEIREINANVAGEAYHAEALEMAIVAGKDHF